VEHTEPTAPNHEPMEIKSQDLPLHADAAGTVRLSGTRVPLETVVSVFHQGATPEEVVHRFPVLDLADVYAVVGYYLRHRDEVQQYMARQTERAESVRGQVVAGRGPGPSRATPGSQGEQDRGHMRSGGRPMRISTTSFARFSAERQTPTWCGCKTSGSPGSTTRRSSDGA